MVSVGKGLTKWVTLPLLAIGAAAAKLSLDFGKTMTKVEALVGLTGAQVAKAKQQILALAGDVGRSPQELGEAYYFLASSGLNAKQSMDALRASALASAAGLGKTAVIADAVSSAMNAYGPSVLSATKATDILLAAVREGKAEPEEFAGAIGRVIPVAQVMGVSFGEVAGMMAALSLNGTDANEAVTQITAALAQAIKPTKQGAEALKSVDMTFASLRDLIAREGLQQAFLDLKKAFHGNVEAIGAVFGNVRSLRGEMTLTGPSAKKYGKIIQDVSRASGDTAKAAAIALSKPGAKLEKAWAKTQAALIKAGDVIVPVLADVAESVGKVVDAFGRLPKGTQTTFVKIAAGAALLGPAAVTIGKLALALLSFNKQAKIANAVGGLSGLSKGLPGVAAGAGGAFPGVGAAGASGGAAAGSALAAYAGAVAAALAPIVVTTVLQKTQKYVEGRQGAAATSQQNKGAGGAFYGSSKGYGAGSGLYKGSQINTGVEPLVQKLIIDSGSSDKALNRTLDIIADVRKAAAQGIDLHIGEKQTISEMMGLRHELIAQLDLTGKEADRILKAVFGKEYKLHADPKPMSQAAMQAQGKVKQLQDTLRNVGAMKVTPSVVVKTSGVENLAYVKDMIAGINSKTVTLNILKNYGYTAPEIPQAAGGVHYLRSATRFLGGEAGDEIAAFIPTNDPRRALQLYGEIGDMLAGAFPSSGRTNVSRAGGGAPDAGSVQGSSFGASRAPVAIHIHGNVYGDDDLVGLVMEGIQQAEDEARAGEA